MKRITEKFPHEYYGFLFHYYRAEVYRETSWRNRLDVTTNWAILITAAILSFVFGNPGISHAVIIINYLIVWFFLYIEARRFRYYSLVRERVKLFEKHILGGIFSLDEIPEDSDDWISELGEKLVKPKIKMSRLESLSWRLRRNYIFILPIMFLVWFYKVGSYPYQIMTVEQFFYNARIGFVPGLIVFFGMLTSLLTAIVIAFYIPTKYGRSDLP